METEIARKSVILMEMESDDVHLVTDRFVLRTLQVEDAETLGVAVEWIQAKRAQQERLGYSPWAVISRTDGRLVGFCGLFAREVQGITLGYAILPNDQGRGCATESAGAVLDWAEGRGIPVYASIRPPNPASVRVLERIGMQLADRGRDASGERWIFRRRGVQGRAGEPVRIYDLQNRRDP